MFNRRPILTKPIPELPSVDGWKTLPIEECGEPLVPLGSFSKYSQIATDSIYVGERISSPYPSMKLDGALLTVFVREGVAKRLAQAASLLPREHMLLVWDAYRPLAVQKALFDYFVEVLEAKGASHDQATIDAQKFVSIPSEDPTRPPPHNTGGAVDLTVIRFSHKVWARMKELNEIVIQPETKKNGLQIFAAEMERLQIIRQQSLLFEMGTVFDGVQPQTATRYYEKLDFTGHVSALDYEICNSRRILYNVMTASGFSNYHEEWWHYDFGNQFHTARTGVPAIYGAATFSGDNNEHEQIRTGHYRGCNRISDGHPPQTKVPHDLYLFVRDITMRTGDLRQTMHQQAAAI